MTTLGVVVLCLVSGVTLLWHQKRFGPRHDPTADDALPLLEQVFHDSADGIVILGQNGQVLRASKKACDLFGMRDTGDLNLPDEVLALAPVHRPEAEQSRIETRTMEIGNGRNRMLLGCRATFSTVRFGAHGPPHRRRAEQIATLVIRDLTLLTQQERDIAYLYNYDERTGALRRHSFLAFLDLRLEDPKPGAVFTLTLDRFKTINGTLGRDVGDTLLREVVTRLEQSDLHLSAAARIGGTSFAVYTENTVDADTAAEIAHAIRAEIGRPYSLADVNATIAVRIGYAVIYPDRDQPTARLLEQAEEALDRTKASGASVACHDHSVSQAQRRARGIERAMVEALRNDEFCLVFQPQHRVSDGRLTGVEALIRWHSPTLGLIRPDEFINVAEKTGYIVDIGRWTLTAAARAAKALPHDLTVAVNVSGLQLMDPGFALDVDQALKAADLPAHRLCLELTETVLMASTDAVIEAMQDLSFLGLSWALDDFGTGFSSMEYLSKMPLDKVKLDKCFTMQLGKDPAAFPILHSTSELCRGLGVKLLCEGVETEEQLAILSSEQCQEAQGYLFGKPMDFDQLLRHAETACRA